jgi:murein hydrolase activator
MVKSLLLYISLLIIFSAGFSFSQDDITKRKTELQNIRDEISNLENQIKQQSKKEKESYAAIENYNKQSFLLNKLIAKLRSEEKAKQDEISENQKSIKDLEKQIDLLQKNYSKYVVAVYKYSKMDELAGIFDSESLQQAMVRIKYLQSFSERRQNDLKKFQKSKQELVDLREKLEKEVKEKKLVTSEKKKEEAGLEEKLAVRKKVLKRIKNNKTELRKELNAKKDSETQIQNLISKLIEEERKRKEEELARLNKGSNNKTNSGDISSPGYDVDLSTDNFESFASLKGKLNWPVHGKIIEEFGENRNARLNTVTLNHGIDIKASNDLSVKAVAEGVVSVLDFIPGYGSVIIISHKDDYRTVYSHLSEIYVNEGDKVKAGSLIAKIGESLEGYVLHFEIWNSRDNQNPELWFAKR